MLIAGAGPVGLTAALELSRRGVACRLVDRLPERLPYAKAMGIQPRTLEVWDRTGVARAALDAAVPLRGQLTYVNGAAQGHMEMSLPPEVIVRPDGYLGARVSPAAPGPLSAALTRVFAA